MSDLFIRLRNSLFLSASLALAAPVAAQDIALPAADEPSEEPAKERAFKAPAVEALRGQVTLWLDETKVPDGPRTQALALWSGDEELPADQLLDRLVMTFALIDPRAQALAAYCSQPRVSVVLPDFAWLTKDDEPAFMRHNLRLALGRWFSRERLFEESLEQLTGLNPPDVIDPASLLFYQSVGHHKLLQKEPGIKAIRQLLDEVDGSPQRYTALAALMHDDLKALKDDSLDSISRQMDDIKRRLDLGRAGPKVRKIEDDVVASLDKVIEELEKQQQQQQQQGGGGQQSANPAPDSQILQGKGPGDVDKKNIGSKSGWGDLPPKKREEALQQIGKDFPPHYREVIEQYFRKLAGEEKK